MKSILNDKADIRYSMLGLRIQSGWRDYINHRQYEQGREEKPERAQEEFYQETFDSVSQAC